MKLNYLYLVIVVCLFFSCSQNEEEFVEDSPLTIEKPTNNLEEPLTADFDFNTLIINEQDDIGVTNLSTGATSYEWDFGNGTKSYNKIPDFKYLIHGTYYVRLKVKNDKGEEASVKKSIEVLCLFGGGIHTTEESEI